MLSEHSLTYTGAVVRAAPLPPDERRAAILAAARPLVAAHGSRVTTAQIAEAAGIAEGTLFRVFATKAEIIVAVIRDALDSRSMIDWVRTQHYPTLAGAARSILGELQRCYAEVSAMFAALYTLGSDAQDAAKPLAYDRASAVAQQLELVKAVAASLSEHHDELRVTPQVAASFLIGLATISSHGLVSDGTLTDLDLLLDLFLHGTTKDGSCGSSSHGISAPTPG